QSPSSVFYTLSLHDALPIWIGVEAECQFGRALPVNVTGAMGAVASEFGLPWNICRGLAVMGRAIGLVGHILEESKNPMADEIYIDRKSTRLNSSHVKISYAV